MYRLRLKGHRQAACDIFEPLPQTAKHQVSPDADGHDTGSNGIISTVGALNRTAGWLCQISEWRLTWPAASPGTAASYWLRAQHDQKTIPQHDFTLVPLPCHLVFTALHFALPRRQAFGKPGIMGTAGDHRLGSHGATPRLAVAHPSHSFKPSRLFDASLPVGETGSIILRPRGRHTISLVPHLTHWLTPCTAPLNGLLLAHLPPLPAS